MIDVAQATAPISDSWTMYLTIVTILFLIIQTVIIAFQTGLFRRQTKILEEQTRLGESVELSIKLVHQDPLTSPSNQLLLKVTNEGKGLAMHPVVDCYLVNFKSVKKRLATLHRTLCDYASDRVFLSFTCLYRIYPGTAQE